MQARCLIRRSFLLVFKPASAGSVKVALGMVVLSSETQATSCSSLVPDQAKPLGNLIRAAPAGHLIAPLVSVASYVVHARLAVAESM